MKAKLVILRKEETVPVRIIYWQLRASSLNIFFFLLYLLFFFFFLLSSFLSPPSTLSSFFLFVIEGLWTIDFLNDRRNTEVSRTRFVP